MNFDIIDKPIQFHLHGISGVVENQNFGEAGLRLMNAMWQAIQEAKIKTKGINHWVYTPDCKLFVGVEVQQPDMVPTSGQLEPLAFELSRYLKHVHIGPYQELPRKWKDLKAELCARGEVIGSPSLEVYGHHCEDPAKTETTILIGLQKKN